MDRLEELDAFLFANENPDGCMQVSQLDGFIHGVVCSPDTIEPKEWIPAALAENSQDIPDWAVEAVLVRHGEINLKLLYDAPMVEPIFWQTAEGQVIAMDWCKGFMKAVSLRTEEWLSLLENQIHGHLVTPIMANLMDENDIVRVGIPEDRFFTALDKSAERIPKAVEGIFRFWIDHC